MHKISWQMTVLWMMIDVQDSATWFAGPLFYCIDYLLGHTIKRNKNGNSSRDINRHTETPNVCITSIPIAFHILNLKATWKPMLANTQLYRTLTFCHSHNNRRCHVLNIMEAISRDKKINQINLNIIYHD